MGKFIFFITSILVCLQSQAQSVGLSVNSKTPFNPDFEGIYSLKISCADASPKCNDAIFSKIDRLTIINGSRTLGTWVTIASHEHGDVIDTFMATNINPSDEDKVSGSPHLGSGFGDHGGRFAYFDLNLNESNGSFTGNLVDSQTTYKYKITGSKIRIAKDTAIGVSPFTIKEISGSYYGTFGEFKGTLNITELPDGRMIGYFTGDEQFLGASFLTFNYIAGNFDTTTGVLKLVFLNQKFTALGELIVSVKVKNQKIVLEGFQCTTFADYSVKMVMQ